ncbi:MAG: DUF3795 domain-containing protein [Planctomycetota bacterium]|nr:DUF3795 domain-containing protein [Planctomycetota bacterium]
MNAKAVQYVSYCGLSCKRCWGLTASLSKAAQSLREAVKRVGLKEFWHEIPFLGSYEQFKKSLDGLMRLHCTKTCRKGGGNPDCKIRECVRAKKSIGCWECLGFKKCGKLHKKFVRNLNRIRKVGPARFLREAK